MVGIQWYPLDPGLFTTCALDESVHVWDSKTLQSCFQFQTHSPVHVHGWNALGTLIAAGGDRAITLLDPHSGAQSHSFLGHEGGVYSLDWCPTKEFLLASGGADGQIKLWDIRKANPCISTMQHNEDSCVNGVKFLSDGLSLISTATDQRLHRWHVEGERLDIDFGPHARNHRVNAIHMAVLDNVPSVPSLLFYPSYSNEILVYNYQNGRLVKRLKGHLGPVMQVCHWDHALYSCGQRDGFLEWTKV